jgi:hypothetical protein
MVTYSSARLAGFLTAHTISSLYREPRKGFVPLLGRVNQDDTLSLASMPYAQKDNVNVLLAPYSEVSKAAAFVKRSQTIVANGKSFNCISVSFIEYEGEFNSHSVVEMQTPYTPKRLFSKLKIHTPKLVSLPEFYREEKYETALLEAFIFGSGEHEEGSAIWDISVDESI